MSAQQVSTTVVLAAFMSTVDAAGSLGAPEGPLYAALMSYGITLDMFQSLVRTVLGLGLVERCGAHVLKTTERGHRLAQEIDEVLASAKGGAA